MLADRVKETTATTGIGTVTLSGAASGFQTFVSALSVGSVVDYALVSGTAWETGRGTLATSSTLSRDEVYASSAAGAKITLAGTSDVFITPSAQAFGGKQNLHGIASTSAAPSAITNGLRRVSLDNGQNVDLTYDTATRTVTLSQTGGVIYWFKGHKVTGGASITYQHATGANQYFIYFDDTTAALKVSNTTWNLTEAVPVALVYWDGSKGTAWDERHTAQRDPMMHAYLHNTAGTRWGSGGVLSSYTVEGTTTASVQYAVSSASVFDEDIRVDTTALAAGGPYSVWYKNAGVWTFDAAPTVPYEFGTTIQYQSGASLAGLQFGQFVNYYVYATTSLLPVHQVIQIPGQNVYANLGDALREGLHEVDFAGLPIVECTPMYRITYYCDPAVSTPGDAVLVDVMRLGGDKNFDPDNSASTRAPDVQTIGRVMAQARGYAMP